MLKRQIGRKPKALVDIQAQCEYGFPVVSKNYPLIIDDDDFEIFPTFFWLTCPVLVEQVDKIESRGVIASLERELAEDAELKESYIKAVNEYKKERIKALKEEDKIYLKNRGAFSALQKGIGGISDIEHLKCLHLHVAHEIARSNPIGKLVFKRYGLSYCMSDKPYCFKKFGMEGKEH